MHHPFAAQVDHRTGLLQFRLPLVTAIGNDHLGPEFALSLNYSLLDLEDVGYGKGFSANLSRYDPVSRLLTLSNGEQYRLDGNESEPAFSPPAPLHLRLKKGNEALWVYYKSGVVEQLIIPQAKGVAQKHYLLNRVFSPTGHEIIFTYVALNGRLRLAQIKDAQQTLIDIDWTALSHVDSQTPSPHQIQLTVWPGLPQSHRVFLLKKQGTLTQVSKYDNFDTTHCGAGAICQLGYDHQDRLVSLRLPGGINESFTYCADGAVRPLPCIESHSTRVMDNQATLYQQTQTFHFTNIDFLNADDPLSRPGMLSPGQSYSSHIHIIREDRSPLTQEAPSTGSEILTRHYDSYHRLVSEEHLTDIMLNNQRKRSEHRILLTYPHPVNDATTMPLAQLPRTYCLPAKKEERWRTPFSDSSKQYSDLQPEREEFTFYNYDVDGNLTLCIYPDGSLFTLTYYSAGGNLPECPADPLGFCRFAAEVSFEIPAGDTPTKQIRRIYYDYSALPCHRPTVLPHDTVVLCRQATYAIFNFSRPLSPAETLAQHAAGKDAPKVPNRVDVKTLEISYYNEPEATFGSRHGRLKSQCITYTTEKEKTVVSKEYRWEKRTIRDTIAAGYELVCTCHFNAGETLADTHPATDAGAQQQRPRRTAPVDTLGTPGSMPAQRDSDAQQTLTTTTCWSLPDYHPTTYIDAQGSRTDYRYQNNGLDLFVTRYAQTPCAAEQHRTIRYNLLQNTLVHISETDCLGNTVHHYHDGFGRLHSKTYTSAPLADNPVTLEERRYDGAGRLTSMALNDWQMTAPAPTQIARNLCEYYYDEWGEVGIILHHDGEQGQYHLIQNDIPNHCQTREQFPYDVASCSIDLRTCASGVVEEHYDLFGRPAKLLREARSASTLAGLQSYINSPLRPGEATQPLDAGLPTGEQACDFNNIGKLISAVEFQRDDMQRIVKITETLSKQYVNYRYGYHDCLSLVNICGTGDIRYSYDHYDGPATRVRFIPPFRVQQPSSKPATDPYVLYECSRDRWGRVLSENHGGQGANVWRYKGAHPGPVGYTDACQHSVQYRYHDHLKHALVEIKHADSHRRFTYDDVGRLITIQDHFLPDTAGPCLSYEYNSAGQLVRETVCGPRNEGGFWTEYDYSLFGRVLQSRDSLGRVRLYSYNRAGQLRALTTSEVELHLDYDAFGRLAQHTVTERNTGKGLRRELRYGFFNRVTQIAMTPCGPQKPDARAILITLKYNEWDRITDRTITETVANLSRSRHEAFDYDHRGCLTDCRFKGDLPLLVSDGQTDRQVLCLAFKRDDIANITQVVTRTQPVGAAAADAADETEFTVNYLYQDSEVPTRLSGITLAGEPETSTKILYDDVGRITQDQQGYRYYYDHFGHLILLARPGHDYTLYHYDPAGRLLASGDKQGETVYLYSQNQLTHIKHAARDTPFPPQALLEAISKDDMAAVSGIINGLTADIDLDINKGGSTRSTLFHYGNTHALISRSERQTSWPSVVLLAADQQGNTVLAGVNARIDYHPWGQAVTHQTDNAGSAVTPSEDIPRYRGYLLDTAVNGYFIGLDQRWYQPECRRFLSPAAQRFPGEGGFNHHAFMMNDPINQTFYGARDTITGRLPPPLGKAAAPQTQPRFDTLLSATPPLDILLTATDFTWAACTIASGALESKDPLASCAMLWSSKSLALAAGCGEALIGDSRGRPSPLDAFHGQSPASLKYGNNQVNYYSDYRLQNDLVRTSLLPSQTMLQPGHHGLMLPASHGPAAFARPPLLQRQAADGQSGSVDHPLLMLINYAAGTQSARQLACLLSRPMAPFSMALCPSNSDTAGTVPPLMTGCGFASAAINSCAAHTYYFFIGHRPVTFVGDMLLHPDRHFAGGRPVSGAEAAFMPPFPSAF